MQVQCWILLCNTSLKTLSYLNESSGICLFLAWWCNRGNAMQMQPDARGFPVTLAHYIWDTPKQWDTITLHLIYEHAVCVRACPGLALPGHKRCINLISPALFQVFSPTYGVCAFAPLFHLLISVTWASLTPPPPSQNCYFTCLSVSFVFFFPFLFQSSVGRLFLLVSVFHIHHLKWSAFA